MSNIPCDSTFDPSEFLTEEQKMLFSWSIGDETSWPKATGDPEVNYAVDRYVQGYEELPLAWNELPESEKDIWILDAKLMGKYSD